MTDEWLKGDKILITDCVKYHIGKIGKFIETTPSGYPVSTLESGEQCTASKAVNLSLRGRKAYATFMKRARRMPDGTFFISKQFDREEFEKTAKEVKETFKEPKQSIDWKEMREEINEYLHEEGFNYAGDIISIVKKYVKE